MRFPEGGNVNLHLRGLRVRPHEDDAPVAHRDGARGGAIHVHGVDRPAEEDQVGWVADALAYYKVPTRWETRNAPLPRNATGKVLKNALRKSQDSMFIEE